MPVSRDRQSKSVTFVYGGVSGILLLTVAVVALIVVPPSPPSVAEFAPSADETIDEAPDQQSSRFGAGGDGTCGDGQAGCDAVEGEAGTTTTTAATSARRQEIVKARVRRCVGDPPRQTEDPQSPPCVNYFDGDNGGATTKGVTRDEIRVVWAGTRYNERRYVQPILDHFNRRFEFYGRRLRLVELPTRGLDAPPEEQRAKAQKVDDDVKAFASLGYSSWAETQAAHYYDELARRRIISIDFLAQGRSERRDHARHAPFQWTYQPPTDEMFGHAVEWTCKRLEGRTAAFAGGRQRVSQRRFGIVVITPDAVTTDVQAFRDGLAGCAGPVPVYEVNDAPSATRTRERVALASMERDGITSAFCVCGSVQFEQVLIANSNSAYRPEWIFAGHAGVGSTTAYNGSREAADQLENLFGLYGGNKHGGLDHEPWWAAAKDAAPEVELYPEEPTSFQADRFYRSLMVLAAGIQMAGPRLTPETFAKALYDTRFPNPSCGRPPLYQACVDFSPSDHSMVNDVTTVWFDRLATPSEGRFGGAPGDWCYERRGERRARGTWGSDDLEIHDRSQPCR